MCLHAGYLLQQQHDLHVGPILCTTFPDSPGLTGVYYGRLLFSVQAVLHLDPAKTKIAIGTKPRSLHVYPIAAGPARAGNGISERPYDERVEAVGWSNDREIPNRIAVGGAPGRLEPTRTRFG